MKTVVCRLNLILGCILAAAALAACATPTPRPVQLATPLAFTRPVFLSPLVWTRERTVMQRAPQGYAGFGVASPQIQSLERALRESLALNGATLHSNPDDPGALSVQLELRQYALAANTAGTGEFYSRIAGAGFACEERFFAAARADSSDEIFARIGEAAISRTLLALARCLETASAPYEPPRDFEGGRALYFSSRSEALAFLPKTLPHMECVSYITDAYGMRCGAYIFRDLPVADWSQYLTD